MGRGSTAGGARNEGLSTGGRSMSDGHRTARWVERSNCQQPAGHDWTTGCSMHCSCSTYVCNMHACTAAACAEHKGPQHLISTDSCCALRPSTAAVTDRPSFPAVRAGTCRLLSLSLSLSLSLCQRLPQLQTCIRNLSLNQQQPNSQQPTGKTNLTFTERSPVAR